LSFTSQNGLNDRLETSQKAKQALLEKFRSRPGADDPEFMKRQAERRAIAEARAEREAAKEAIRRAEAERLAAEEAARKEAERIAAEEAELKRLEEEEARAKARPKQIYREIAAYAEARARAAARGGRR
jgi:membrane protein involved in colicin uptake